MFLDGTNESGGARGQLAAVDAAHPNPDLAGLLARVPAIVYIAGAGGDGRWDYVSHQIEEILGFTPGEWCADPSNWARQLHPDDREHVLGDEEATLRGVGDTAPIEYRMLHKDGHVVWLRDEAALIAGEDGQPRWHGVMSDVTARKQAEAALEQRAAQQAAVARLGERALEGVGIEELLQQAVEVLAETLDVEMATVIELLADSDSFVIRSAVGWPEGVVGTVHFSAGGASQAGYTTNTGGPVVVSDWELEQRFRRPPILEEIGARSGMTVAIEGRNGRFGVLGVQSTRPMDFNAGDIDFVQALANILADALARKATEDDIRHRALHDPVTGLPNRVLFLDRLEQARARVRNQGALTAVLFLDLDHFKLVNDSLGHEQGDELLAAVASRLRQVVKSSDTVARFGGDEFGILLEDIAGVRVATETAERIAAVFTRPFLLDGSEHFVTASIGIAFAQSAKPAAELIRDADAAMYRAKEHGRARYELFDEVMRAHAVSRLRVDNDLRRAIERDELLVHYQPLVSLVDHSVTAVEALVRWAHPERGLVGPCDFIPVAEENGLIEPIGRWVLEQACEQAAEWYRTRPDEPPISVSVNLSPLQAVNPRFPALVAEMVGKTGLDPSYLNFELTETMMLREGGTLMAVLQALKKLGVRLSLDDFGTGYSSLSYLTHLPLDVIKVDRSFVDGLGLEPRDTAITETIIAMSRALSLEVVAEGVETEVQAAELRRLGCDMAQGFWFSPPLEASAVTKLLQRNALVAGCSGETVAVPHS